MQNLIKDSIQELLNHNDFKQRNLLLTNSNLIPLDYKSVCISSDEYSNIVDQIYIQCYQNGTVVSKNIIRARLNNILLDNCKDYFTKLEESISYLDNHPFYEQKSDEWLSQRKTMLTGTDAGKVIAIRLGKEKEEKLFQIAKDKLDMKKILQVANISHFKITAYAMTHGNIYEDVSLAIYESRNKVKVKEYGLIKSNNSNFIGASPDGVVTNVDYSDYNSFKRYGRLVEVKNPYSRKINNDIKPEYVFQMLQQEYTCGISVCDFLETMIIDLECRNGSSKPYTNIKEMLNDVIDTSDDDWKKKVQNHNIPITNLSSDGKEKGYLISFKRFRNNSRDNFDMKTMLFPINEHYSAKKIIEWKKKTISEMEKQGFTEYVPKVWKLDTLDVKEFVFNAKDYVSEKLPVLESSWNKINDFKTKLIDIIKKKQKFLSTPEILAYIKGLTYSRYLTMMNDVSLNSTSSDDMNTANSISNNSTKSSTNSNKKSNINLDNYL